jgi:hypothetical protein
VVLGQVHKQRVGVVVALAAELAVGVSSTAVAVALFQMRVVLLLRVGALLRGEDLWRAARSMIEGDKRVIGRYMVR